MAWYIDADAVSNGDGSELSPFDGWINFLAGAAGDLTGLGEVDVFIKGEITDPNALGFQFNVDGFLNASASNYLHFKPWPGFEGDGSYGSMPGWASGTTGGGSQYIAFGSFHRVSNLQFRPTNTGAMDAFNFNQTVYTGVVVVAAGIPLRYNFTGHTSTLQACLAVSDLSGGGTAFRASAGSTAIRYLNCTAVNTGAAGGTAFENRSSNGEVKNCVAYGGFSIEYVDSVTNASNNAGQLAAASQPANIQTNYVQLLADPFVDSANNDYAPADGGALDGAGVAVSGFTADAGGNAWANPPSIGYLEVVPDAAALAAEQGSYALAGQDVTLTAIQNASLSAEQGSYALTGRDANLLGENVLAAEQGDYALTGQDVTLTPSGAQASLTAEHGSYILLGSVALADYAVVAEQGSYALTGQDVTIIAGLNFSLSAERGDYALAGQDTALRPPRRLTAEAGSYRLFGQATAGDGKPVPRRIWPTVSQVGLFA